MTKNVFIVKCNREKFEKYFSKKKNSDVINHHDIRERLTNNDVFRTPPTPEIVQFQIVKRINSFTKCKSSEFLFLYREELTTDFIDGIKDLFHPCDFEINYHLVTDDEAISNRISKKFNSVQKMEYDKV
jgi:hypothetical protein